MWTALVAGCDGDDERDFFWFVPAALAAIVLVFLATVDGIVNLDAAIEFAGSLGLLHDRHQLVAHQRGRAWRHAELARDFETGD